MKIRFLLCAAAVLLFGGTATAVMAGTKSAAKDGAALEIGRQQLEGQIYFFKESLDLLAPQTPEEAVHLWVKGDETRNGVYKYAAADKRIKGWLTERWGEPEKSFWIIGSSSPWLTDYEIVEKTRMEDKAVLYTVVYDWGSSVGPEKPTTELITVTKYRKGWGVSKIEPINGFQNY